MATGPHTRIISLLYRRTLKPLFFAFDAEDMHDRFTNIGALLGSTPLGRMATRIAFRYQHPALRTIVAGIRFENPVGLAAGFDKNARLTNILPDVGFGFEEVGSITGKPCAGNPRPRLWRIPSAEALRVYYGLVNDGADAISARMRGAVFRFPIGISAAKTNSPLTVEPEAAIADYCHVVEQFRGIGDYLTVNISCPNAFGGQPFTDPNLLERLLTRVDQLADLPDGKAGKPVFLKLSPDLSEQQLDALLDVSARHRVDGFVCTNLTKDDQRGGISGKPVRHRSDAQIEHVYRKTNGQKAIIGVGGIFSAEDAYRKIRKGASLVQLITGMIYQGPQLIGDINRGLVRLLKRDGFTAISQAVGADVSMGS
jgi:dihydroorotate dehydrogenase subfamily 2